MKGEGGTLHFAGADGIRGLACLIVLALHVLAFNFTDSLPYYAGLPKAGVWLFFVLSAFLLTAHLHTRGLGVASVLDYGISRFLRIYPLYALIVIAGYVLGNVAIETPQDVWLALSMQRGYAQLWTIPVEFKFYAALPAIVWVSDRIYRRANFRGLTVAIFAATAIHQAAFPYWQLAPDDTATIPYLPAFLFGTLAAYAHLYGHDGWMKRNGAWLSAAMLVALFAVSPLARYLALGIDPAGYLHNKFLFFAAGWAIFICAQAESTGTVGKILASKPMVRIGQWSYSIYLVHILVIQKLVLKWPDNALVAGACFSASIFIGRAMYLHCEVPLMELRRYFVTRIHLISAATSSPRA